MRLSTGLAKLSMLFLVTGFCIELGNDRKSTAETMKMLSKGLMKLDAVIANIERKALRLTPRQKKGILNKTAIRLGNLAKAEVKLIIMRTGEQGAQIDSLISQINDKSYELKMALIQLQQTNGPTSYFPAVQAVLTPNFPSILHRNSRAGKQSANDLYLRLEK